MINHIKDYRYHFSAIGQLQYGDRIETRIEVIHIKTTIEDTKELDEHLQTHYRVGYSVLGALDDNPDFGIKGEMCLVGYFPFDESADPSHTIRKQIAPTMWEEVTKRIVENTQSMGISAEKLDISADEGVRYLRRAKRQDNVTYNKKPIT